MGANGLYFRPGSPGVAAEGMQVFAIRNQAARYIWTADSNHMQDCLSGALHLDF